jgi:hypothetical protein
LHRPLIESARKIHFLDEKPTMSTLASRVAEASLSRHRLAAVHHQQPKLVIAQCKAGVVGSMPALNARPAELLDEWLAEITESLAAWDARDHPDKPAAPFAINQIVHKSNDRLDHDMAGVRQVQGADRHHQPGRARGREPGGARLGRHRAARHHQQQVCAQGD